MIPRTILLVGLGLGGVVFGAVIALLFEDLFRIGPDPSLSSSRRPSPVVELPRPQAEPPPPTEPQSAPTPVPAVKYKVRVGPYPTREAAGVAGAKLKSQGYTVLITPTPPFLIQVGAFTNPAYAEELKQKLLGQGYQVLIKQE